MDKTYKEEFLSNMIDHVKELPIEKVIGRVVELHPKGRYYLGLCPFHPDHKLGSFVVTPEKNIWHCFTDNIGGNAIGFEMKYYDISFLKACFKLALDFNIITQEEYRNYTKKKWNDAFVKTIQQKAIKKIDEKKADKNIINLVYNVIPVVCGLSDVHREHLLKERGLQEEDLADYFTFPTRHFNLPTKIIDYIQNQGSFQNIELLKEQFPYIPGFYKHKDTGKLDFASYKGIGFIVRDEKGKALGIQIRRDKINKGEKRYVWFSSSFAYTRDDCEGGVSSGSPGGIIFPKNVTKKTPICITEGRFKAVKIAQTGSIAIYVSGVSSWKRILPIIDAVLENRRKIYIIFDSDMLGNVAVHTQMQLLASELKSRHKYLEPILIVWSIKHGKGIDDLINNNSDYKELMKYIPWTEFESIYNTELYGVLKNVIGVTSVREIPKTDVETFVSSLQNVVEKELELK